MKIERPQIGQGTLEESDDLTGWLQECEQIGQPLTARLFKNQAVANIEIENVDIKKCVFQNCRFVDCRFVQASFTDVIFEKCDLSNCKWEQAAMQRAEFLGCKLVGQRRPTAFGTTSTWKTAAVPILTLQKA